MPTRWCPAERNGAEGWPTVCRWTATGHRRPPAGLLPDHGHRHPCRWACRKGKTDNQILGVVQVAAASAPARGGAGVQGHQHAHQGASAGLAGRGLLQRQDPGRRRPALHRRAAAAADFWERNGHGWSWQRATITYYRVSGPLAQNAGQPVRLLRGNPGEPAARQGDRRSPARACAATLRDCTHPSKRLGCDRATESRTSRSTC